MSTSAAGGLLSRTPRGCPFDLPGVRGSPFAQWAERRREGLPELRERVVDTRWDLAVVDALHDSVGLEFLQLLDQHLVRDGTHGALELSIAERAFAQMIKDQRLPLSAKHGERRLETA